MLGSPLYLISDRKSSAEGTMIANIEQALIGGLKIVQLRDKDLDTTSLVNLGQKLRKLCDKYQATFIVNRNIEVLKQCRADGLHLGSDSINQINEIKTQFSDNILIGISTHSVKEAQKAEKMGADYVTLGPAYETPSKKGMGRPLGPVEVGKGAKLLTIPVFALGGVEFSKIAELKDNGIKHVAMIRAILAQEDPRQATINLLKIME